MVAYSYGLGNYGGGEFVGSGSV